MAEVPRACLVRPDPTTKRVALFEQSISIASMFSGYLQVALYTGMNGWLPKLAKGAVSSTCGSKTKGTVPHRSTPFPQPGNVISVVASLVFGTIADRTGRRKEYCAIVCVIVIIANIMLSIWDIPRPALLFAFFLSFVSAAAQPLIIAWGQEVTQKNAELRQMLVATGNIFTYTFMAWVPLVAFTTYDAPHYKYGYQPLIMFGGLAIVGVYLFGWLDEWDRKRQAARIDVALRRVRTRKP
ncbi:major facilitator superfamily domain-containing protein [Aspergillus terricola var. indicus]